MFCYQIDDMKFIIRRPDRYTLKPNSEILSKTNEYTPTPRTEATSYTRLIDILVLTYLFSIAMLFACALPAGNSIKANTM